MPNLLHKNKTCGKQNDLNRETISSSALIESALPCNTLQTNDMLDEQNTSKQAKYTNRFRSVVYRLFRRHFNSSSNSNNINQENKNINHTTNNCCC